MKQTYITRFPVNMHCSSCVSVVWHSFLLNLFTSYDHIGYGRTQKCARLNLEASPSTTRDTTKLLISEKLTVDASFSCPMNYWRGVAEDADYVSSMTRTSMGAITIQSLSTHRPAQSYIRPSVRPGPMRLCGVISSNWQRVRIRLFIPKVASEGIVCVRIWICHNMCSRWAALLSERWTQKQTAAPLATAK